MRDLLAGDIVVVFRADGSMEADLAFLVREAGGESSVFAEDPGDPLYRLLLTRTLFSDDTSEEKKYLCGRLFDLAREELAGDLTRVSPGALN